MILRGVVGPYVDAMTEGGIKDYAKTRFELLTHCVFCCCRGRLRRWKFTVWERIFERIAVCERPRPRGDLDKNSSVTCDEWQSYTTQLFTEADGNGDGALSVDEFKQVIRSDRLFQSASHEYYDVNGDGKVMLAEMIGKPNPAFQILDKNKDCQIGPQ